MRVAGVAAGRAGSEATIKELSDHPALAVLDHRHLQPPAGALNCLDAAP